MQNPVPRVAAIHDLSGFGRASLTVIIPILSTMGVQACPLPTAVLSTHTGGFKGYHFVDLTEDMVRMIDHWKALDIAFDAVYSGFLGSPRQVNIVIDFIKSFARPEQLVAVDPVMGDNGKPYKTMGPEMIRQMRLLVSKADIITPNFTEAAFLLDEPYPENIGEKQVKQWIVRLCDKGPGKVIITSVPVPGRQNVSAVVAFDREDGRFWKVDCTYVPAYYPGTGDAFASVIVGGLLQGDSLPIALDRAVQFVSMAIRSTFGYNCPSREGVLLERVLTNLRAPVTSSSYEIME
ncbi:MAG: pyridoxamine kinase [Deltaproteobacteria bacterium]|nr:MAG: pyridoxamine kinase [Deltaproteobacteria bacterium]